MNRIVVGVAILSACLSLLICWRTLGLIPHVADELSYSFQGRVLAAGKLWLDPPAVPDAFTTKGDHILRFSGKWRAIYPPGWPLLLAIGWILQAPWLVNPLLLAAAVVGTYTLAVQLFDRATGLVAILAFVTSPFVLLMSSGYMSHAPTLCFFMWCMVFLLRGKEGDLWKAAALGGFAFMIRPYTAVPLILPAMIATIYHSRDKARALRDLIIGVLPPLILFGLYNYFLFGNPLHPGYHFDPDAEFRGSLRGHLLSNVPWYIVTLNHTLWRWPWPDLLIFLPLLWPHRQWKKDLLLALCFFSLLIAYSFFYYHDIVYSGPRYVYEAVGLLSILAARSLLIVRDRLQNMISPKASRALLFIFLYPLIVSLPKQLEFHSQAFHGEDKELLDLAESNAIPKDALILIAGNPYVYRTFFLQNSLDPADGERVYARDIPDLREQIVAAYQRKQTWRMQIDLKTLAGPNPYPDRAFIRGVHWQRLK